jgi:cysteine desulfurase/selenocysteine lyase
MSLNAFNSKDFPQLHEGFHYLDTAASSLTPRSVLDAMEEYYRGYRANVHRGIYAESVRATNAYEGARTKIAQFIGALPREVIFTPGSTHSANMIVRMLEESFEWKEGERILTTVAEHHGTLVPLQEFAARRKLALEYLDLTKDRLSFAVQGYPLDQGVPLNEGVRVVSLILASNVTGTRYPVEEFAKKAKEAGALVITDATAAVGHVPVDVRTLGVDALWFSGHKMLGPTGIGVLWVKDELLSKLRPSIFGGGMIEKVSKVSSTWAGIPERFEAGTPNIAGAIGLGAAAEYLSAIGIENVGQHVSGLAASAIGALSALPGVRVLSPVENNVGIVSFVVDDVHPHDVGQILANHGVAVRTGHHCAMPLHEALGVKASTRASFYVYTTEEDIVALVEAVREAQKTFA